MKNDLLKSAHDTPLVSGEPERSAPRRAKPAVGAAFMLLSVCGFSTMGIVFRIGRESIGAGTAMFWRSIVGIVVTLLYAAAARRNPLGKNYLMLFLRGLAGASALLFFFTSARMIDLGTTTALCYTYPFVAAFLSMIFLKEAVGAKGWIAIAASWVGIAVIVGFRPSLGMGEAAGFLSGILAGIAIHAVRAMRKKGEPVESILFWFFAIGILLSLPFARREDASLGFSSGALVELIAIGISATVGQVALTKAYKDLPTRFGSAFSLLVVPCSMAGAYFLANEIPSTHALVGTALLGASLIVLANASSES